MTTEIENTQQSDASIAEARIQCEAACGTAVFVQSENREPVSLPASIHGYGEAIELTKRGITLMGGARSHLLETLARLKAAYADELRGGKSALNDAQKRELDLRLEADQTYVSAMAVADSLQSLIARWDARRSRLSRDFEIARIDYAAGTAVDVTEAALVKLRSKLFNAADYFANRLRGVL